MIGFNDRRARFMKTLAATASALCLASGAAAEPDEARIELESGTASAFLGWYWAKGTLITEEGKTPFCLEGPTFGQVGGAHGVAVGRVRHLERPSDLVGRYAVAEAGATFARGSRAIAMRNNKGVVITLISEDEGLLMGLGGRALRLRVDCGEESSQRRGA